MHEPWEPDQLLVLQAPKVPRAKKASPGQDWSKSELRSLEEHLTGLGSGRTAELRENVRARITEIPTSFTSS